MSSGSFFPTNTNVPEFVPNMNLNTSTPAFSPSAQPFNPKQQVEIPVKVD